MYLIGSWPPGVSAPLLIKTIIHFSRLHHAALTGLLYALALNPYMPGLSVLVQARQRSRGCLAMVFVYLCDVCVRVCEGVACACV